MLQYLLSQDTLIFVNLTMKINKPFIIAEIGGNHEGSIKYAKKLLIDAARAGADAVKFQTYFPEKIVSRVEDYDRYKHFSKFSLPIENYFELANLAKENNVLFMSSIWDAESLKSLNSLIKIHKIGSGDLTNIPLIKKILDTKKPLIISTAMASLKEIQETVSCIYEYDNLYRDPNMLAILQCVAMYGNPKDEYANLLCIPELKNTFPYATIGYSDHTIGNYAANLSFALGAEILEVHFTDNKDQEFRDHHISVTAPELQSLRENINKTLSMLGSAKKEPIKDIETPERIIEFRRACYLKKDLAKGEIISSDILTTLRPCKGIDAKDYEKLIGKKLRVDKKAFSSIFWNEIE